MRAGPTVAITGIEFKLGKARVGRNIPKGRTMQQRIKFGTVGGIVKIAQNHYIFEPLGDQTLVLGGNRQ